MQNGSVDTNLAAVAQGLLARAEEPSAEFAAAILGFDLLVVLEIIADDQARTLPVPLAAADLLLCAAGDEAEFVAVDALDNDVGLLVSDELEDLEISDDVFVLAELIGYVAEVFDRHLFARADDD